MHLTLYIEDEQLHYLYLVPIDTYIHGFRQEKLWVHSQVASKYGYKEGYTYYLQGTLSNISSTDSISQKCSKVAPETHHTGKEKFYTLIQLHAQR